MWEEKDQKNSEYGQLSRTDSVLHYLFVKIANKPKLLKFSQQNFHGRHFTLGSSKILKAFFFFFSINIFLNIVIACNDFCKIIF